VAYCLVSSRSHWLLRRLCGGPWCLLASLRRTQVVHTRASPCARCRPPHCIVCRIWGTSIFSGLVAHGPFTSRPAIVYRDPVSLSPPDAFLVPHAGPTATPSFLVHFLHLLPMKLSPDNYYFLETYLLLTPWMFQAMRLRGMLTCALHAAQSGGMSDLTGFIGFHPDRTLKHNKQREDHLAG
jgi:hypothetical protein